MKNKTAIILGATGLTGSLLLQQLLKDERYTKIILFGRRTVGISNEKIEEHLIDLFRLKEYSNHFKADEVYCCIGTTKAKTPNAETYKKIDVDIPVTAAKLCAENKIPSFIAISAMGADTNSKITYNKLKGKMETGILAQNIPKTHLLRPSLIGGKRSERRLGESIGKILMKIVNPLMIGSLKNYRSIDPKDIASAMIILANREIKKIVFLSNEIKQLVLKS